MYKRNDSKEWHGPGTVIGRDGKQVLVKHGGTFVRVHTCRLARYPSKCNKNISSVIDPCDSKTENEINGEKDSNDSDDDEIEKAALTNAENIATLDVTEPDVV